MKIALCSSRTLLFILGLLFLAATVVIWGLGGYILATYKQISQFSVAYLTWVPAIVMIFVGVIFLVAGVSGCVTSCNKNRACSFTFFLFVFLTFVALVTATVMIFVYKRQINDLVIKDSNLTFDGYKQPGQELLTTQVDFVQTHLECCGTDNYTSWEYSTWGQHNHSHQVPLSCCKNTSECLGGFVDRMKPVDQYIYTNGCIEKVQNFLQRNLRYLAAGTIGFLLLLIVGMIAACVVFCRKEENPYFNLA